MTIHFTRSNNIAFYALCLPALILRKEERTKVITKVTCTNCILLLQDRLQHQIHGLQETLETLKELTK